MSAAHVTVDLDDTDGLLNADHDGLLRGAAMAGAQVRAVASALAEGALDSVADGQRPRSLVWVGGRGAPDSAGAILAAALGGVASEPIVVAPEVPPWIGPLDVVIVAGDDAGDSALVAAAAMGVRRGARVVVAAPFEGPLRDATAGRVAVFEPRMRVPDEFGLSRYLAVGLATLRAVDPGFDIDLEAFADELDAEALRNSVARDSFTNPAKVLAGRMSGRRVILAGQGPATIALARHAAVLLVRLAGVTAAPVGLTDALVALRMGMPGQFDDPMQALFHDEELDGPLPHRMRAFVLMLESERPVVTARVTGIDDGDTVGIEGTPEAAEPGTAPDLPRRTEQQLAILAVRLEMTAVYLRLVGG